MVLNQGEAQGIKAILHLIAKEIKIGMKGESGIIKGSCRKN
jgi:hypothetical protein